MANFFDAMLQNVNNVLNSFVTSFSSAIISEISGLVYSGLVLYFMWLGFAYARGHSDEPIIDTGWHILKVGCIVSIALTVGTYQDWIVNSVLDLPDALITSVMASAMGGNVQTGSGLATLLDTTFFRGLEVANQYFENGQIGLTDMDLMPYINGVLIIAGTVLCLIIAAFWLFATKIVLALLLGVGPIFIVALIWNPTKHFFGTWLSTILSLVFINLFIMGTFSIFVTIFEVYLQNMNPESTDTNHLGDSVIVLTMGLITCGVLLIMPTYVAQLTGGSMAIGNAWATVKNVASSTGGAAQSSANMAGAAAQNVNAGANKFAETGGKLYGGYQTYSASRTQGMSRSSSFDAAASKVSSYYKN